MRHLRDSNGVRVSNGLACQRAWRDLCRADPRTRAAYPRSGSYFVVLPPRARTNGTFVIRWLVADGGRDTDHQQQPLGGRPAAPEAALPAAAENDERARPPDGRST